MARGRSKEDSQRLTLTHYFRSFLLSDDNDPPVGVVIEFGAVPVFVEYLKRDDFPELQYQAIGALSEIATGPSAKTKVVVDHGAVPLFVKLLSARRDGVREKATWALGNIAGCTLECRNLVLANGALSPLLSLMNEQQAKLSFLEAATCALSNFCGDKPRPAFDQVKPALPALARMIGLKNESILINACGALFSLSDGNNVEIQAVCDSGVCPRLINLLLHPSPYVSQAALSTVGNIVKGDENHIQMLIDNGVLPCLYTLLTERDLESHIEMNVCKQISKITEGNNDQIQAVISAGLISPLVQMLLSADVDLKKVAAMAVTNVMVHGSHDQIKTVVDDNDRCFRAFCDILKDLDSDKRIVRASLGAMEKIMDAGEVEMIEGLPGGANRYFLEFADLEGLDTIVKLHNHADLEIRKKADSVLEYFAYAGVKKNRGVQS